MRSRRPALFGGKRARAIAFWSASAILLQLSLVILWFVDRRAYIRLGIEDSIGENLTAACYGIAAISLALASARRIRNKSSSWLRETLPLLLCLFFLFVAGEEISWGERLLGFSGPEFVRSRNLQHEMNFHNLSWFDKNRAWINQHTALNWFVLFIGFLIPVISGALPGCRRLLVRINFPVVPLEFSMFFLCGLIHGQTIDKLYPHWAHSEIRELLFGIGFCLFAVSATLRRGGSHNPNHS